VILSAHDAIIPPRKPCDYVLSSAHPEGRFKAAYFLHLGYSQADWEQLDADLREQHLSREAEPGTPSPYGEKYEILAPLTGPNGVTAWVRSVWIVLSGENAARLVTLIPEERR
jgi:hypothetical protein